MSGDRLNNVDGECVTYRTEFQQLIGALQYLTMTHRDISYVVNYIC